ncbi:hypothetical protein ACFC0X_02990 [Paenibacillus chitinolyticus]|uniref:hypothetical protein n=1 Tax=Paenibacillus chitinolyticus TaxID=79263 RepID=UPI0035DF1BE2
MSKRNFKRLSTFDDKVVQIETPIHEDEIHNRQNDYSLLPPQQFAKKYRSLLFQPVKITYKGKPFEINTNHCLDPYCKWFGLPQRKFDDVKGKPHRYFIGSPKDGKQRINCNDDPINHGKGQLTLNCSTPTASNWSLAEEILRLETLNRTQSF